VRPAFDWLSVKAPATWFALHANFEATLGLPLNVDAKILLDGKARARRAGEDVTARDFKLTGIGAGAQGCLKVVISPSKADSSVIWLATEACF